MYFQIIRNIIPYILDRSAFRGGHCTYTRTVYEQNAVFYLFCHWNTLLSHEGVSRCRHESLTTLVSCLCNTDVYWAMSFNKLVP
jgi:hypothetical protein